MLLRGPARVVHRALLPLLGRLDRAATRAARRAATARGRPVGRRDPARGPPRGRLAAVHGLAGPLRARARGARRGGTRRGPGPARALPRARARSRASTTTATGHVHEPRSPTSRSATGCRSSATTSSGSASSARPRSASPASTRTATRARSTSRSTRRRGARLPRAGAPDPRRRSPWARRMTLPLADVRILAVEQFGAGPWGTLQLADLGAEIVKIEDPASAGDVGRYVPPFQEGEDSLFFETFNRGKKSISLDLRHPEARAVLARSRARLRRASTRTSAATSRTKLGPRRTSSCKRRQPAHRLLLALGLRDDRAARPRGRLRLHDAGARGLAEPDRRARRASDEERALARRPLGWLCLRDRPAGGDLARTPRRRGLRLRRLALRDGAARADVHRHRGRRPTATCRRDGQLGASVDRPVPELPGRRRLVRRRRREADLLGAALRGDRPPRAAGRRAVRDDGGAQRASRRAAAACWTRRFASRTVDEWVGALVAAGVPASRINSVAGGARRPAGRGARGRRRARPSVARHASARSAPRSGSRGERPSSGPRSAGRSAASTRRRCSSSSAATRRSGCASSSRAASSATGCRRHERDGTRPASATARAPPDPRWPGGQRVALSLVLNYEEGGENTPLEGDPASEAYLHEVIGAPPTVGRRNLNTESMFEFGSRAGFWRVHRIFTSLGLPLTVFAVGQALERNPAAARAMVDAGWEVASHGWRWIDYGELSEDEEREHIRRAIAAIEGACGVRPVGWYTGRGTEARAGSSSRRAASSTTRTRTPTSCRTGSRCPGSSTSSSRTRSTRTTSSSSCRTGSSRRTTSRRTSSTRSTARARRAGGCCPSASTAGSSVAREDAGARPLPRARRGPRRRLGRDAGRDRAALARRAPTTPVTS